MRHARVQELCACATPGWPAAPPGWPAAPKRGDYRSDNDGGHLPARISSKQPSTVDPADERNHTRLRRRQVATLRATGRAGVTDSSPTPHGKTATLAHRSSTHANERPTLPDRGRHAPARAEIYLSVEERWT